MKTFMTDQLVFVAPPDLRERLDAMPGDSLAQKVRAAVEGGLWLAALDPPTRDLVYSVADAGRHSERNYGKWHESATARECVRAAVNYMLDRFGGSGKPAPVKPNPESFAHTLFGDKEASPEEAARSIVSWTVTEFLRRHETRQG
jgi:hypothetical protein